MFSISVKVAYPIIIAGVFIMVTFIAADYQNLSPGFYIVLAMLIVYIFLFGFATGQNFAQPVRKLLKRANDLSEGDVKSRFYLRRADELGELSRVFNKIAEELEKSRYETSMLEKSLDIKVKARTQSLEETINALEQKVKNRTMELQRISDEMERVKADHKQEAPVQEVAAEPKKPVIRRPRKSHKKEGEAVSEPAENLSPETPPQENPPSSLPPAA